MLFINSLQVVLLLLLIIEESLSVLLPDDGLLLINLFFLDLLLVLLIHLTSQVLSHLLFMLFSNFFASLLLLFLLFELIFDVTHHFLVLSSNLLFLVLDDRVSKRSHDCLDLLLPLFFLLLSFSFELILETSVLLLSLNILNCNNCTSILYFSASSLIRR